MAAQPRPPLLPLLLLCLLTLQGTPRGAPSASALELEDGGQTNLLPAFVGDEPAGEQPPTPCPDLALPSPDSLEANAGAPESPGSSEGLPPDASAEGPEAVPEAPEATKETLAGQGVPPQNSSEGEEGPPSGPACDREVSPKAVAAIARGLLRLGVGLLREMEQDDARGNLVFSPLSVGLALAHLALGAANETERQLLEALHAGSVPCFHRALCRLSQRLRQAELSLAGQIFLEKGFPVKEKFLEDSERLYGAKPATLSGDAAADLEAVNSWVKEATGGQIPSMLSDLPADVAMLLLNAVHFRGFWQTQFDPLLTERSPFHLDEDFAVSVDMMKARVYPLSWFTVDALDVQVARFPFKGNTSLVAVLPNHFEGNFSQLLGQLHRADLQHPFPKEKPTLVKMPKLLLRYHLDLSQALSRLGLGKLFSGPDLSRIAEGPLVVSGVQHQAALELTEAGVEASAATSVAMSRSLSAFHLDRPFAFVIFHDPSGVPLFLGTVRNPDPGAPRQRKAEGCLASDSRESSPRPCATDTEKP